MKPSETLQVELERRILQGLRLEWENALDPLDEEMADRMQPPLFSLSNAEAQLGSWHPRTREIRISRRLVLAHPWDAVCDVLRHEMAHQLVDTCWPNTNEVPHGPRFQTACHLLRARPEASGDYPTLDQRVYANAAGKNDRMLARIRKLMALSDSPNNHEAEAAMVKAHSLIAKYNLDLARSDTRADYVSVYLGQPALRHFREAYGLGSLLQDHYFVRGVWVPAYVLAKAKMGRVLEINGTRANVQIAAYVYDFVNTYIDGAWERYCAHQKRSRYRRTDFALGLIDGFREKLETAMTDSQSRPPVEVRALVRQDELKLQNYVDHRYPRLHSVRRGGRVDPEVRAAGEAAGRKMVISKGIRQEGRSGPPGLLPGS